MALRDSPPDAPPHPRQPLDYAAPSIARPRWRWLLRTLIILIVTLLLTIAAESITYRIDSTYVDTVTGSMSSRTTWLHGLYSNSQTTVSPLETRLRTSGIPWAPQWRLLSEHYVTLLTRARACNTDAHHIHGNFLPNFVAASSDDELHEFIRIMESGTNAEQRAAVEAAMEKALNYLPAPPPPR